MQIAPAHFHTNSTPCLIFLLVSLPLIWDIAPISSLLAQEPVVYACLIFAAVSPLISDLCERIRNNWLGSGEERRFCCYRTSLYVLELVLLSRAKLWRTPDTMSGLFVLSSYHQSELAVFPLPNSPLLLLQASFFSSQMAAEISEIHMHIDYIWCIQCHPLWPWTSVRFGLIRPRAGLLGMECASCANNVILSLFFSLILKPLAFLG